MPSAHLNGWRSTTLRLMRNILSSLFDIKKKCERHRRPSAVSNKLTVGRSRPPSDHNGRPALEPLSGAPPGRSRSRPLLVSRRPAPAPGLPPAVATGPLWKWTLVMEISGSRRPNGSESYLRRERGRKKERRYRGEKKASRRRREMEIETNIKIKIEQWSPSPMDTRYHYQKSQQFVAGFLDRNRISDERGIGGEGVRTAHYAAAEGLNTAHRRNDKSLILRRARIKDETWEKAALAGRAPDCRWNLHINYRHKND
ncbi:hypothetical protein EVAR_36797_1 [Eumeta japonica]|uniref:Uncharacterized protein n=1 Tax=Eumeta variegata TaxID=151549 RepID=A0A4C1WYR5_EUMVA|nr:hypothetical protein EVAR_36797_1 [Eumeta japonica]